MLALGHLRTMRAVGCENSESSQVDPGLRHQGDKLSNEAQRLEDNVCGAILVRCLELVMHVAIGGERVRIWSGKTT